MKKYFLSGILLMVASFCLMAQETTPVQYKIGDKGPGGGIIFNVSETTIWELSEPLGHMTWDKAFNICPEYHSGTHEDWYLPSKDELESIYYNLVKPGLIQDEDTYWSSNQEESMALWGYNFEKGRPGLYGATKKLAVRAVRHFEAQ